MIIVGRQLKPSSIQPPAVEGSLKWQRRREKKPRKQEWRTHDVYTSTCGVQAAGSMQDYTRHESIKDMQEANRIKLQISSDHAPELGATDYMPQTD